MKTLSGLLTINKPQGMTSRQTVTRVTNLLRKAGYGRQIKVGHCGTLDPLATGLVVICIGRSTRLVQMVQEQPKTYAGTFQLGRVTSTDDCTGETLSETYLDPEFVSRETISALLPEFTGRIQQVPPKFSAVHVDGQRAYKLARKGHDVELAPRPVQIHRLDLSAFELPEFELQIECGSGTYIRSIARDLGELLGCGGLMTSLERTAIGEFPVTAAIAPDSLAVDSIGDVMTDPLRIVAGLPKYRCGDGDEGLVRIGRQLLICETRLHAPDGTNVTQASEVAIVSADGKRLLALGELNRQNADIQPRTVFIR